MWELNYHSPQLLADRGFLYDSSLMDADVPYELAVDGTRSIVEIPIQWALDDWEQYCYIPDFSGAGYIASPPVVLEMWSLEFEAIRAEGGCFVLTNHPFLSGRPSRAAALEQLMERVTGSDGVWVTTMQEVAEHVRGLGLRPRSLPRPLLDGESANR
jgi:peptidoglycan/xylan/chitin deacetylase (PgdA/CDA1 family)